LIRDIIRAIPENEYSSETFELSTETFDLISKYATTDQFNALTALYADTSYYISPNNDGLADTIGMTVASNRFYHYNGLNIYNDKGELLVTGEDVDVMLRPDRFNAEPFGILKLDEGVYTAQITGSINYKPSIENPQKLEFQFTVDKTAPELRSELIEKNGRKILRITAKDSNLDGIYITGFKGSDEADLNTLDMIKNAMGIIRMTSGNFIKRPFSASELPLIGKILTGTAKETDLNSIDFADMLAAKPDKNGAYTFEYDITDFQSYTISAMDKAYNISSVESERNSAEQITEGVYLTDTELFSFANDTMKCISLKDGTAREERYTLKNGELVWGDCVYKVYQINDTSIRLAGDGTSKTLTYFGEGTYAEYPFYTTDQLEKRYKDIIINEFGYDSARTEITVNSGIASMDGYATYKGREAWFGDYKVNIFSGDIADAASENMPDLFPITFEDFAQNAILMTVEAGKIYYLDFDAGKKIAQEDGKETPISCASNNTDLQLSLSADNKPTVFSDYSFLEKGNVAVLTVKTEEGEEPAEMTLLYSSAPDEFSFYTSDKLSAMAVDYYKTQHGEYSGTPECFADETTGFVIIQMTDNEAYAVDAQTAAGFNQDGEEIALTGAGDPADNKEAAVTEIPDNAYSLEELKEMAMKDYEAKTGVKPDSAEAVYNSDGSATISIFDAENESLNEYTVDSVTGKGVNKDGEIVNLPQTGTNTASYILIVIAAALMVVLGIVIIRFSGIGRHKKEDKE
jgi:LPXTG-motif cell wall-anchored protein